MDKNIVYFTNRKDWRNWLSNNFEEELKEIKNSPEIQGFSYAITKWCGS